LLGQRQPETLDPDISMPPRYQRGGFPAYRLQNRLDKKLSIRYVSFNARVRR
jgi:hypothetical protein